MSKRKNTNSSNSDKMGNKKRPTKMTIRTENLIEYNATYEKENDNQSNHVQTNTKSQANKHLRNNQNITERKKQKTNTKKHKMK